MARRAIIAQYRESDSDESSFDEKEEIANLCLMARADENDEVLSTSTITLSYNDLKEALKELQEIFDELHDKPLSLLKEHKMLKKNKSNENEKKEIEKLKKEKSI